MAKHINRQKLWNILIPLMVAAVVVSSMAVAGKITKSHSNSAVPTTSQSEAENSDEAQQDAAVNLVAVGDNLIHMQIISSGEQEDGSYDYNAMYDAISPYIKAADVAVINQETVLGGNAFEYSGYPLFNSPWEVGDAAINAGFDVFTLATNHSMDMGAAGIEKEIEYFSQHPDIVRLGTNLTEEDYNKVTYMTVNGIKFALLNYTYGTNGISIPEDRPYLVNLLDEAKIKQDVNEARENADVVIAFPHWGTENSQDVNEQQENYVKLFSDLGVDIVIGTHPHVLQKVEWVTNESTGKKTIVYYSIGNFISRQINLNQMLGGMAEITVERKAGEISITSAKLAPVVDYYSRTETGYKFSVYKLADYTEELAATQEQQGATPEYFTTLAKDVVGEEYLDLN